MMRWVVGTVLLMVAAGCSTPTAGEDRAGHEAFEEASSELDEAHGPSALRGFPASADTPPIESFDWGDDGALRLGFADGKWARIEPGTKEARVGPVTDSADRILALSPGGKLAVVASQPPMVVRLRDHQTVMRLRSVDTLETAGFFADGEGLFAAEPDGNLHVWGQSERALGDVSLKDLERFMARQTPDFTANLSSLNGSVLVTDANALIMATADGTVLRWRPDTPNEIDAVVQLPAAATSLSFDGRFLAATTADGSLRAIDLSEQTFLPWSTDQTGRLAAASPSLADRFVVADNGTLGMRAFEDGNYDWKAELPAGEPCGLTLSSDADLLAVCVDGGVMLVDPTTGKAISAFRRTEDTIEWREDPSRER